MSEHDVPVVAVDLNQTPPTITVRLNGRQHKIETTVELCKVASDLLESKGSAIASVRWPGGRREIVSVRENVGG
jgi:hypothetical protein